MPQQNDQREPRDEESRKKDSAVAASADLGATYAALLDGPMWQIDAIDTAEAPEGIQSVLPVDSPAISEGADPPPAKDSGRSVADTNAATMPASLLRIMEALLFVGGGPLTTEQACAMVRGLTPSELVEALERLDRDYRAQGRPYRIRSTDKGHELVLRPRYLTLVDKMVGATREARLSSAALDVLALIAYRQPMAKRDIDGMRGAECGGVLRQLVRRGLLTVVHQETEGKCESVYRTTQRFIKLFQLRGLEDLPHTEDLKKL